MANSTSLSFDHAQVAVVGLTGMHEEGRVLLYLNRSRPSFRRDDPTLAHAGKDQSFRTSRRMSSTAPLIVICGPYAPYAKRELAWA